MTKKLMREREFAKCIEVEEVRITINVDDIVVEESYSGPKLNSIDEINVEWAVKLMDYLQN